MVHESLFLRFLEKIAHVSVVFHFVPTGYYDFLFLLLNHPYKSI